MSSDVGFVELGVIETEIEDSSLVQCNMTILLHKELSSLVLRVGITIKERDWKIARPSFTSNQGDSSHDRRYGRHQAQSIRISFNRTKTALLRSELGSFASVCSTKVSAVNTTLDVEYAPSEAQRGMRELYHPLIALRPAVVAHCHGHPK